MAEIQIERRPRRSGWTWVALLLVLAGVAVGAWLVFGDGAVENGAAPAAETTAPAPEPVDRPDITEPAPPTDQGDVGDTPEPAAPEGGGAGAAVEPEPVGAGVGLRT